MAGPLAVVRRAAHDPVHHVVPEGRPQNDYVVVERLEGLRTAGGNDTSTGALGDAVEEFLRLTSPVQGLARTTTRDPRRFGPDADELDVRRRPSQVLSFGQDHHHCLGAAAARLQVEVALEELVRRIPDFAVDEAAIRWAPGPYVRRRGARWSAPTSPGSARGRTR